MLHLKILSKNCPIVYMKNIVPVDYLFIIKLNPMYYIVDSYHQVLLYAEHPNKMYLLIVSCLGTIFLLIFIFIYHRSKSELIDVL